MAQKRTDPIVEMYQNGNRGSEAYVKLVEEEMREQERMGEELFRAEVVSWISLFFLPTQALLFYMGLKTNKRGAATF